MSEDLDINAEYEQIFGKKERPNIFSPDDEEYNTFRQEILDAKREFNPGKKMPFDGIKLLSYEDFQRNEIVRQAEKNGYRIFYIKNYEGGKLSVYAAGYFNANNSSFVVLKDAFFKETSYFNHLVNNIAIGKRFTFRSSFAVKDGLMHQKNQMVYDSASLAASYLLGKKTTFRVWRDDRGKSLDAYYAKYKADTIDAAEDKTFPDYKEPERDPDVMNLDIDEIPRIPRATQTSTHVTAPQMQANNGRHLFYINVVGNHRAIGYYDKESNYFYICKDSYIAINEDPDYAGTPSSTARTRFLEMACAFTNYEYRVTKDTKCRNASAAACYVLGKKVTYSLWRDANGKYLKDFYPESFFVGGESAPSKTENVRSVFTSSLRLFYIKRDVVIERTCDAVGRYDATTQKFILQEGSILSMGCAPSFEYTPAGTARKSFLCKYCTKEKIGYRLKRDFVCDTPSNAACYVLGRSANGWMEWKGKKGFSLDKVYRNQ